MATKLHRVHRVHNTRYHKSGLKSYGHLLSKYGFTPTKPGPFVTVEQDEGKLKQIAHKLIGGRRDTKPHRLMKKDLDSGEIGEVGAEDVQNDSLYLCPVSIGTPAQTLMLDFDTGSSDLWVWSNELPASLLGSAKGHTIFDPSKSSTFKTMPNSSWKIQYGDGSTASGNVGTDNVSIGGVVVQNQAVELSENLSRQFQQGTGDGLLGLAWPSINTVKPEKAPTPVANMITENLISGNSKLFTAYLGSWRDANEPDKGESFYTFGFIDQDTLERLGASPDNIWYTPVDNSEGFWMFSSTSATINGNAVQLAGNKAIADTGTTLALVSDNVCEAIYKAIPGARYDNANQGYLFPTNTIVDNLPAVSFDVGGMLFHVHKEDLGFADAGNGMTYGGIQSRGNLPFDILGDTFLKNIYAIFDQGNTRFGAIHRSEQYQNLAPGSK